MVKINIITRPCIKGEYLHWPWVCVWRILDFFN